MLACTAHGSDVENKTYGEMADAMKETLDELGFVIVTKKTMEIYHEDQKEKEDMSCDNAM